MSKIWFYSEMFSIIRSVHDRYFFIYLMESTSDHDTESEKKNNKLVSFFLLLVLAICMNFNSSSGQKPLLFS